MTQEAPNLLEMQGRNRFVIVKLCGTVDDAAGSVKSHFDINHHEYIC
jgi:hypothetical protein